MQPFPEQFTRPPEVHGGERRQSARRSPFALTYVTLGENNGGIIANISETGMSVTAGEPLRESFLSRISFRLSQTDAAIETRAEIVWTSESKKEAGVRFVELREENRERIRTWISPARRNGDGAERAVESADAGKVQTKAVTSSVTESAAGADAAADGTAGTAKPPEESNGRVLDAEPGDAMPGAGPQAFGAEEATAIHAAEFATARVDEEPPLLAFTGFGQKAWALTESQRAEFERLFPSEALGRYSRETTAPEDGGGARAAIEPVAEAVAEPGADPVAEVAPPAPAAFVAPIADAGPQPAAQATTLHHEHLSVPAAAVASELAREPEVERAITESPATPFEPAAAASAATAVAAAAAPRTPTQSLWNIPPRELEPIIDRSFGSSFGSSFGAVATESLEERRPRSLWRVAALSALLVAACFALGFAAGPFSLHVWPKVKDDGRMVLAKFGHEHAAAINVGGANSSATNVPAPGANAAAPAVPSAAAMSSAPDSAEPAAGNAAATDANASSAGGNTVPPPAAVAPDTATIPPARTTGDADSTAKERGGEPPDSAARTTARDTPVEKAHASSDATTEAKANSAAGAGHAEVAAPSSTAAETHETSSTPAEGSSSGAKVASAPAANSAESAAGPAIPATPPQSYFPVVAPAAGNVPRLIQLPEEIVIDTAAVVIHSHQMVFVPAEPGPEASHELEKLQIGDRVTKVAPIYPPAAAQKGMGGTVHLLAVIGKDGKVQDVRPINGPIGLVTAAVDAILQWRYQPTLLNQQPIEMQEQFTIEFRPLGLPVR